MSIKTITSTVLLIFAFTFSQASQAKNVIRLHCGDFGTKTSVNKEVYKTPQIKIEVNNETDNFFLVIDFDNKKINQYPYQYNNDGKPLLNENQKQSKSIVPLSSEVIKDRGVSYTSWASAGSATNLEEFIYISSKIKMGGKEDYFGGILTKVETTVIDSTDKAPNISIMPSVTTKQFLCSKIFDFSTK